MFLCSLGGFVWVFGIIQVPLNDLLEQALVVAQGFLNDCQPCVIVL